MSVTIDKEIQKAEVLAAGLRKHLEEVGKHGVTEEGIKKMEELCVELREVCKHLENCWKNYISFFWKKVAQKIAYIRNFLYLCTRFRKRNERVIIG